MKKMIIAFSALAMVFVSCKKDEESKAVTPTKENLTGVWMVTSAKISSGGASVDMFSSFDACQKDDKYHFNGDLTYQVEDAGTQCDPSTSSDGTWALTNATTINIDGEVGTIDSFDGKNLVVTEDMGNGKMTTTFVKQ
ncbi:MAG: lipocalin family protein [Flavisolibacter sp.]